MNTTYRIKRGATLLLLFLTTFTLSAATVDKQLILKLGRDLTDSEGNATTKNLAANKYTVLFFGSSWNGLCKKLVPELVSFYNDQKTEKNFDIVFISSDFDATKATQFMQKSGIGFCALNLNNKALKTKLTTACKAKHLPTLVAINQYGKILLTSSQSAKSSSKFVSHSAFLPCFSAILSGKNPAKVANAPLTKPMPKLQANSKPLKFKKTAEVGKNALKYIKGICVDRKDNLYIGGVGGIRVFDKRGNQIHQWSTAKTVSCLAVSNKGYVYAGFAGSYSNRMKVLESAGDIIKYSNDGTGTVVQRFSDISKDKQIGTPVGISIWKDTLIISDIWTRSIHKFTTQGIYQGDLCIYNGRKKGNLRTCCGLLDCCFDRKGRVHIANLGAYQVRSMDLDGNKESSWGKKGTDIKDFCGCCNPTNIAMTRNDYIVTSEKTIPKIKIFSKKGKKLLAVFGEGEFSKNCGNLDLAVDSRMNVYALDNWSNCIKKYSPPTP